MLLLGEMLADFGVPLPWRRRAAPPATPGGDSAQPQKAMGRRSEGRVKGQAETNKVGGVGG